MIDALFSLVVIFTFLGFAAVVALALVLAVEGLFWIEKKFQERGE